MKNAFTFTKEAKLLMNGIIIAFCDNPETAEFLANAANGMNAFSAAVGPSTADALVKKATKRIVQNGKSNSYKCGHCGDLGHNRRACPVLKKLDPVTGKAHK